MGEKCLIDTNTLIEFQGKLLPANGHTYVASVIDDEFNISVINKIETLGSRHVTQETENFIALATVFDLDKSIVDATIKLRKKHKIKLPDAVIAATAIVNKFTLITINVKDFLNIKGLRVINPHDL